MYSRLLLFMVLLTGLPLAAQETMVVTSDESVAAFACAGEGCERLAWLPDGAGVNVTG